MRKLLQLPVLLLLLAQANAQNVGVGTTNPQQKLDVSGAVKIGTTAVNNAGAIRYNSGKFEGGTGTLWKNFEDVPSGGVVGALTNNFGPLLNNGYSYYGQIPGITTYGTLTGQTFPAGTWLPTYYEGVPGKQAPPSLLSLGTPIVWTGTEMILMNNFAAYRYNPVTDVWTFTSKPGSFPFTNLAMRESAWTGTEVIIWGGNFSTPVNNGIRFNPATNTWNTISAVNQPSARTNFSCIWTGSRMFVWGGQNTSGTLSDGALYDPATDTWTTVSATNAPTARREHSTVWTGSLVVIWGGSSTLGSAAGQQLDDGRYYNPATNVWTNVATVNAPTDRHAHTAVYTGSEMIVWGGIDNATIRGDGKRLNVSTNTWTVANMSSTGAPSPRYHHSANWTGSRMLIAGGHMGGGGTFDADLYDPATDTWSNGGNFSGSQTKYQHSSITTPDMVIIWQGQFDGGYPSTGFRYLLNPITTDVSYTNTNQSLHLYIKN